MTRMIAMCLTFAMVLQGISGCDGLTEPDEDDIEELAALIEQAPQEAQDVLTDNKENDRLQHAIYFEPWSDEASCGHVRCDTDDITFTAVIIRCRELYDVARANPKLKWRAVVQKINKRAMSQLQMNQSKDGKPPCDGVASWNGTAEEIRKKVQEARSTRSSLDAAWWLPTFDDFAGRPWLIPLFGKIVTADGIVKDGPFAPMLPVMCPKASSDHWSCPGSPEYPPGQSPQPEPDHGDGF